MKTEGHSYRRHGYPAQTIGQAVWLDHRFSLSFREVEDLSAKRGIVISYEIVRQWCAEFVPAYAPALDKRSGPHASVWGSPRST
jgi:putative transposase